MRFRKFIRTYFNFSKRERSGLIVLFILIAGLISFRIGYNSYSITREVDFTEFEDSIEVFLSYQRYNFDDVELFYFDPNTASREELMNLGISPKAINGIYARREKGYKFYKTEDLKRVRGLSEAEYEVIKDYVQIVKTYKSNKNYNKPKKKKNKTKSYADVDYFIFDPNLASEEELVALGLETKQIRTLLKYRDKGGRFNDAEDLKKIYGFTEDDYERLKGYVSIQCDDSVIEEDSSDLNILIEINKATSEDFQQLSGIGQSYSSRIIKYRNLLGGYINKEQLLEVYGFSEELFFSIKDQLYIDSTQVEKININTADFKKLVSHPYINKDDANKILNYRKFAGNIKSLEEMYEQKAVSREFIEKIAPYFTID